MLREGGAWESRVKLLHQPSSSVALECQLSGPLQESRGLEGHRPLGRGSRTALGCGQRELLWAVFSIVEHHPESKASFINRFFCRKSQNLEF